ncbi:Alpha/beta hydrolase domain-containing protein 17C [Thelohanellus kitauei]|uniref:Alpha/beta hydrolase domain-containing protein 17C n=1 Tax=Thelohanellus kitauei TaxID=669202 RepID=A0A0C2MKM2_THEKT|nr:Alpha/beta hydrolase domain-containing protein 17C [Thelohanellus kitauei]
MIINPFDCQPMKFQEYFKLLCSPPWLPTIINKLLFIPPKDNCYVLNVKPDGIVSMSLTNYLFMFDPIPACINIKSYFVDCLKDRIAVVYLKPEVKSRYTILYSHGNSNDLGAIFEMLVKMITKVKCNIIVYDYSGYGSSTGKPCESRIKHNVECVYDFMLSDLNIKPDDIIALGYSIGSVAALHLATVRKVVGVVLHSAIASFIRVLFPKIPWTMFCDKFKNVDTIKKVECLVLVIHGLKDRHVPYSNGVLLHENARNKVEPLWVEHGTHHTVEEFEEYYQSLSRFIHNDIPRHAN